MRISPSDRRVSRCGFAKLVGKDLDFILRKYSCSMGRRSKASHQDIVLGDVMSISRQHADIQYSFENKRWELHIFGKNGVTVDGVTFVPENSPVALQSQNLLQIADHSFYFLLPKDLARRPAKKRARQPKLVALPATNAAPPKQAQQAAPAQKQQVAALHTETHPKTEPPQATTQSRPISDSKPPQDVPAAAAPRPVPGPVLPGPGASSAPPPTAAAAPSFPVQHAQQQAAVMGEDRAPHLPQQGFPPASAALSMGAAFAAGAQHQAMQQAPGGSLSRGPADTASPSHHMLMQQHPQLAAMAAAPAAMSQTQAQVLQQAAAALAQRAQHAGASRPMQGLAPGSGAQQAMQQALHLRHAAAAAQQAQQTSAHQQFQRAQQQQKPGMGLNPQMAQLMMAQAMGRQQQPPQHPLQAMMLQQQGAQQQAPGSQPNAAALAQMLQMQQQAQQGGGGTVNPALMQMLLGIQQQQQQQAQRGHQGGMGYPGSQPFPGNPPM